MGKLTGFLEFERQGEHLAPVVDRLGHYREFVIPLVDEQASTQAARCMDCGIPFCSNGCPVNNLIPDWNDLVYKQDWQNAIAALHATNNFPDFTGRICPAPCEAACTLNIQNNPVTIKAIERAIIDKAWDENWIRPQIAAHKTGKRVAVVGSGPAGLACAQQLARIGHTVVVLEKNDRIGGLLRYGIPDFKLEKTIIDRRIQQMSAEGVEFRVNQYIGVQVPVKTVLDEFDAVVLAGGAEQPRELMVPGRELQGVHCAMEFLVQQNKLNAGDGVSDPIRADGLYVVVIGGGDTGSDCVGTANRHGAASVVQFELLPKPPAQEIGSLTWPYWPLKMRISSSHEEGCVRDFAVATKSFVGENGRVSALNAVRVEWRNGVVQEVPGSDFQIKADLVLLAMGFVSPDKRGLLENLGVELDLRGNVKASISGTNSYASSVHKIFAAGDMRRGQSLVVWAIREGRECAQAVDRFLMGESQP